MVITSKKMQYVGDRLQGQFVLAYVPEWNAPPVMSNCRGLVLADLDSEYVVWDIFNADPRSTQHGDYFSYRDPLDKELWQNCTLRDKAEAFAEAKQNFLERLPRCDGFKQSDLIEWKADKTFLTRQCTERGVEFLRQT
jgi:hypothetical protein